MDKESEEKEKLDTMRYDTKPLTGCTLSKTPYYLLPKPYRIDQGKVIWEKANTNKEARTYGLKMIEDARDIKAVTQVHRCTSTCFKYGKTCRFNFFHIKQLLMKHEEDMRMYMMNQFRHGKKLRPRIEVVQDSGNGRRGQVLPVCIHPQECDSNPFAAVLVRCNLDVQCGHRVVALHTDEDKQIAIQLMQYCVDALTETSTAPTIEILSQSLADREFGNEPENAEKEERWAYSTNKQHYSARVEQMIETIVAAGYTVNGYSLSLKCPKGTQLPHQRLVKAKLENDVRDAQPESNLYKQVFAQ